MLDLPVLTEKDRRDLEFGLAHDVDWVALSFVQKAGDLDEIVAIVNVRAGLVAKIEKPSTLAELEEIVRKADAIMLARGDLGVEIPPEDVPARKKTPLQRQGNFSRCPSAARLNSMPPGSTPGGARRWLLHVAVRPASAPTPVSSWF